jgi:alkylation response protein AidB-like acyl-CoA dehydrogenase
MRTDDPGADPESSRSWWEVSLNARAGTIYAGTSEVQRTILAERALGLPREPRS